MNFLNKIIISALLCTQMLTGADKPNTKPVWKNTSDERGHIQIAYSPQPDTSTILIRRNNKIETLDEKNQRFAAYLDRYLLVTPVKVGEYSSTEKKAKFLPRRNADDILVLEGTIAENYAAAFDRGGFYYDKIEMAQGQNRKVTIGHIPAFNEKWKEFLKLRLVGVENEGELPPFEYLRYLRYGRLAVSLKDFYMHDITFHAIGYQYLAADERWQDYVDAIIRLENVEAKAKSSVDVRYANLFRRITFNLGDDLEKISFAITGAVLEKKPAAIAVEIAKFHAVLDQLNKDIDAELKALE